MVSVGLGLSICELVETEDIGVDSGRLEGLADKRYVR